MSAAAKLCRIEPCKWGSSKTVNAPWLTELLGGNDGCQPRGLTACLTIHFILHSDAYPAIDKQHLAGDVTGSVAAEEEVSFSDVVRVAEAAERDLFDILGFEVFGNGVEHRRHDGARRDAVNRDTGFGEFQRQSARQADDAGLCGGIVRLSDITE